MNLWDRIERWRASAEKDRTENAEMNARLNRGETVTINSTAGPYLDQREACAAELEADLRELKAVVGRVDHETCDDMNCALSVGPHTTCGHPCPDCARCALEARIGRSK